MENIQQELTKDPLSNPRLVCFFLMPSNSAQCTYSFDRMCTTNNTIVNAESVCSSYKVLGFSVNII